MYLSRTFFIRAVVRMAEIRNNVLEALSKSGPRVREPPCKHMQNG